MDSKTILELCDKWRATVIQPDGSGHHNAHSRELTLLNQGCVFQDIDIDAIQAVCVGLTDRLHYRNSGQYIDEDQRQFWEWSAKLFSSDFAKKIIGTEIHSHLTDLVFPSLFCNENPFLEEPRLADPRYNQFVIKLVRNQARLLSYLTFPLLEAVARSICATYISTDGTVLREFSVDGKIYVRGQRCNSLKHALMQAEALSSTALSGLHYRLEQVVQRITPSEPLYMAIYTWRNETLHGNDFAAIKNRIVFNIAILFLLEKCCENYKDLVSIAKKL